MGSQAQPCRRAHGKKESILLSPFATLEEGQEGSAWAEVVHTMHRQRSTAHSMCRGQNAGGPGALALPCVAAEARKGRFPPACVRFSA